MELSTIRHGMPLLARHEGRWEGTYTHVDLDGNVVDQHRSLLTCTLPSDGDHPYHQTNRYTWADGRTEEYGFPGSYRDGKLWFDTERIEGVAWEVDADVMLLRWRRKDLAGATLSELIELSPDGEHRARTWHWYEDGRIVRRTLIEETRVR